MDSRLSTIRRSPEQEYSIGIYRGSSPLDLRPVPESANPVLTRESVTDAKAGLVADPFMTRTKTGWSMFFEVWDLNDRRGKIGLATSRDAAAWTYRRIVLVEPFHLSYPYVFESGGDYYMVPETDQAASVRLYKAASFPDHWQFQCSILGGPRLVDSSIFAWQGRWWIFTETGRPVPHSTLRLFYAETITGPWREHPKSPIVAGNAHKARPAGRVIVWHGNPVRFAQDCEPVYGTAVRAFAITALTPDDYAERPITPEPILCGGAAAWNSGGMHHIDPHLLADGSWLASVDGWRDIARYD